MLDWIAALGAACFGSVVGSIVGFYLAGARELTIRILVSGLGMFAGAGVVALFHLLTAQPPVGREIWFYPIGLAIGFVLGLRFAFEPRKSQGGG